MFDGKQCDPAGQNCVNLGGTRLYAGASWEQPLSYNTPVEYQVSAGLGAVTKQF